MADVNGLVSLPNYVNAYKLVKDTGNENIVAEDMAKDNWKWNGKEKVVECEEDEMEYVNGGSSSDDDDIRRITFDDSENKIGLGLDDGFGLQFSPPMNGTHIVVIKGNEYRVKKRACKIPTKKKGPNKNEARTRTEAAMLLDDVQIVADYVSD
jgi:hypothetical protein